MTDARTLYQELVVDHGTRPRNEGSLPEATHQATLSNPLCGDRVTLRLRVDDGVVTAARFEARGCMIARASASMLTEAVIGLRVERALELVKTLESLVTADPAPAHAGPLEPLRGVRDFAARRGCVLLAWRALETATAVSPGGRDEAPR